MLALVVVGGLIVATHVVVKLEHSIAAAAINRQRAFAASEFALWTSVAVLAPWDAPMVPGGAATDVVRFGADSAIVTTVRLNEHLYWVVADATVGVASFRARRRTATNVRVSTDSVGQPVAAVRRAWVDLH